MHLQADSPSSSESINRGGVSLMDGEHPTIIRGALRPKDLQTAQDSFEKPIMRQRLLAGLWFGVAATVPGFIVLACSVPLDSGQSIGWESLTLLFLIPAMVAGLCGFWIGGNILSGTSIDPSGEAYRTGANVAIRSLCGIAAVLATKYIMNDRTGDNPVEMWFGVFIGACFVSVAFTGWLLIPFGGLAGRMLRWCSELKRNWDADRIAKLYPSSAGPAVYTGTRTLSFPDDSQPVSPSRIRGS